MFAVAIGYLTIPPSLSVTKFSEYAWKDFFRAVVNKQKVNCVYYGETEILRVEYDGENFRFSS